MTNKSTTTQQLLKPTPQRKYFTSFMLRLFWSQRHSITLIFLYPLSSSLHLPAVQTHRPHLQSIRGGEQHPSQTSTERAIQKRWGKVWRRRKNDRSMLMEKMNWTEIKRVKESLGTRDWEEEKVKQTELSPLKLCHAASALKNTLRGGDTS